MRTISTLASFFIVLGLYFLYGWVIVPSVLPSPEETVVFQPVDDPTREEIEPYLPLLPEDGWERNPKSEIHFLRFGQTIMLFGKDESNGNIVKLTPCTIIMIQGLDDPDLSEKESTERIRQAVVMRTPLYAEIEFDREFNLGQFPLPDIKGGKLNGKVTIESAMKEDGPQDDLFLETENVGITETPGLTKIQTVYPVDFRFGYNNGTGTTLTMELTSSDPKKPKSPKTLSLVRFEHLKQLNLVFPEDTALAPKILAGDAGHPSRTVPSGPATFLEIKCQREFEFKSDPASEKTWVAKFLGNADVVRKNPDGTTDNLTAEEVKVKFQPKVLSKAASSKPVAKDVAAKQNTSMQDAGFNNLEPVSFEANGKLQPAVPARLTTQQSGGVVMVGDHLLYNIRNNLLVLETQTLPGASKEVEMVLQNRFFIRGEKSFQYTLGQNGEFGKLLSEGKGNLRGNLGDEKTPRNMFLTWNALSAEPYPMIKNQIILKLWGGIYADMEGFGKMTAGKIDLWCNAEPQKTAATEVNTQNQISPNTLPSLNSPKKDSPFGNRNNITPDRAVVMDNVRFSNDKGTCDVNRLDIFFKTVAANGNATISRWLPQILTEQPPASPWDQQNNQQPLQQAVDSASAVSNIPSNWQNQNGSMIQQVQHQQPYTLPQQNLQPLQIQTRQTGVVPLYQAQPAPPVGSQSTPMMRRQNNVVPSTIPTSAASQSLLGIQSTGNSTLQYAITGKQMSMQVVEYSGRSFVETLAIEGNVKVTEKVALTNIPNNDLVQIAGEEITIWNPSTPETQILISGNQQDALFQGRGIELRGKEINISRPSNKIWVPGVGRLIANTESNNKYFQTNTNAASTPVITATNTLNSLAPLKQVSSQDNRLYVEWNESMIFDGNVLQFLGKPSMNNNRVMTIYQTKQILCDVMEIRLNRTVLLFEDKSDVKPEAETIQCANNVIIESREYDENTNELKAMDKAEFGKLRFWIKNNFFVAEGPSDKPGVLSMTHLSSDKGFSDSKAGLPGTVTSGGSGLTFLSVWFHDQIQGTILGNQREITISGRVQTAYSPVDSWDDKIGIDNINAARRRGYILECERLKIVEMPDSNNGNKSSVELTASENASIDGSKIYGKAREIKYNQAKTLVTFDGNAKIHTFGEDGKKTSQDAETIQYNIETKAVRVNQSTGLIYGP